MERKHKVAVAGVFLAGAVIGYYGVEHILPCIEAVMNGVCTAGCFLF